MMMAGSSVPTGVVRSGAAAWRAVALPGVSVKVLRRNEQTGESTTLVRFEAGTHVPAHNHPGGEEVFVVEGDLEIGPDLLGPGDYLYTPPDGKHAASSEGGCVFLVTLPKPVEFPED
jgi:quercetin dioxygenase-like cupin family protein